MQTIAASPEIEYYQEPAPTFRTRIFRSRILRWLRPEDRAVDTPHRMRDRRHAYRLSRPTVVAYFFTGGAPHPHSVEDISITGFFMQGESLWMPGTIIRMTLQRADTRGDKRGDCITVHSRLVRQGRGGSAFEFVLSGFLDY